MKTVLFLFLSVTQHHTPITQPGYIRLWSPVISVTTQKSRVALLQPRGIIQSISGPLLRHLCTFIILQVPDYIIIIII